MTTETQHDLMIDIETFSLDTFCAAMWAVAVVKFDPYKIEQVPEIAFAAQLRFDESTAIKLCFSYETLQWWFDSQRNLARDKNRDLGECSYVAGLQNVAKEINRDEVRHIWARGPQFDLSNIWYQSQLFGVELKRTSYFWRDSRSFLIENQTDMRNMFDSTNFTAHYCVHDALAEAQLVQVEMQRKLTHG